MHSRNILGLKESLEAINIMISEVETRKDHYWQHGAFAVVDYSGHLIAFAKMDGADELAAMGSIRKAYTAALWGFSTREYRKLINESKGQVSSWGDKFTIAIGGVPILPPSMPYSTYANDAFPNVVGAIGVGHVGVGDPDEEVAIIGVKYLQGVLWPSK